MKCRGKALRGATSERVSQVWNVGIQTTLFRQSDLNYLCPGFRYNLTFSLSISTITTLPRCARWALCVLFIPLVKAACWGQNVVGFSGAFCLFSFVLCLLSSALLYFFLFSFQHTENAPGKK